MGNVAIWWYYVSGVHIYHILIRSHLLHSDIMCACISRKRLRFKNNVMLFLPDVIGHMAKVFQVSTNSFTKSRLNHSYIFNFIMISPFIWIQYGNCLYLIAGFRNDSSGMQLHCVLSFDIKWLDVIDIRIATSSIMTNPSFYNTWWSW